MLGPIRAPAAVNVLQTVARRLSLPAKVAVDGVMDGDIFLAAVGRLTSQSTSRMYIKAWRRAPGPLAVARWYASTFSALPHPPSFTSNEGY